jgi:hypothetical protein
MLKLECVVVRGSGAYLQLEAGGVKNAKFYKYVEVMITENEGSTDKIKYRINQGRILTKQLSSVLLSDKLPKTQRYEFIRH